MSMAITNNYSNYTANYTDTMKKLREQAYEDFAKGQFQNKSEGFNSLMKSYTSEVPYIFISRL